MFFIVNNQNQPLSGFDSFDLVTQQQLKFRKKDCFTFPNRQEAEQFLEYIKKTIRPNQRCQLQYLRIIDGNEDKINW